VNFALGVLSRTPETDVPVAKVVSRTGWFWSWFAPASRSRASFAVTPATPTSMPSWPLSWIEFALMRLPAPALLAMTTPVPTL
jgi:hypothetical protein